jgi:hypothetical protein
VMVADACNLTPRLRPGGIARRCRALDDPETVSKPRRAPEVEAEPRGEEERAPVALDRVKEATLAGPHAHDRASVRRRHPQRLLCAGGTWHHRSEGGSEKERPDRAGHVPLHS